VGIVAALLMRSPKPSQAPAGAEREAVGVH
jgi:hypothetical protein